MNNSVSDFRLFFRDLSIFTAVVTCAGLLSACGGSPRSGDVNLSPEEGKNVSGRPTWVTSNDETPGAGSTAQTTEARSTWAILLGVVSGADADRQAATLAALAAREGKMPGAIIEKRGDGLAVLYGAYDDPGSADAKRDLATAREVKIAGARPFESAIMAAPAVRGTAGSMPEYDLRNARQFTGGAGATLTLQIGIYLRSDNRKPTAEEIAEFRRAAEEAVKTLRSSGDQAFYYHGAERSTITVGLFSDDRDPRLAEARKRHPLNMVNGQKTTTARVGGRGQESFPVRIP